MVPNVFNRIPVVLSGHSKQHGVYENVVKCSVVRHVDMPDLSGNLFHVPYGILIKQIQSGANPAAFEIKTAFSTGTSGIKPMRMAWPR